MSISVWKQSRKQTKFRVEFHLEELSSVPFLAGVIFAKLRLLNGGNFRKHSDREEILDHRVCWNTVFEFECKISATLSTGVLEPCILRVSVRRESQGGKTYDKLGFADVNLSEFATGTQLGRSFLLEEYSSKARANNALLRVTILMRVKEGDYCFKVPTPAPTHCSEIISVVGCKEDPEPQIENDSSQGEHSRQSSSSDSGLIREAGSECGSLERNTPRCVGLSPVVSYIDREKVPSSRVDSTRVDPENLINELLKGSNLHSDSREDGKHGGLSLFIGKDGTAAVIGE